MPIHWLILARVSLIVMPLNRASFILLPPFYSDLLISPPQTLFYFPLFKATTTTAINNLLITIATTTLMKMIVAPMTTVKTVTTAVRRQLHNQQHDFEVNYFEISSILSNLTPLNLTTCHCCCVSRDVIPQRTAFLSSFDGRDWTIN